MRDKVRKCFKCGSTSKDPDVVLYRFPKPGVKNMLRCELWAKFLFPDKPWSSLEFQNKLYSEHRMLCHKHFKKTSFIDYSQKKLHRHAAPVNECDKNAPTNAVTIHGSDLDDTICGDTVEEHISDVSYVDEDNVNRSTQTVQSLLKIATKRIIPPAPLLKQHLPDAITTPIIRQIRPAFTRERSRSVSLASNTDTVPTRVVTQTRPAFTWEKSSSVVTCDTDTLEDTYSETQAQTALEECVWDDKKVPKEPAVEALSAPLYHCNVCEQPITGCRYSCVQCVDWDLCGACEAAGRHPLHYVLRVPPGKPFDEVQTTLQCIRKAVSNAIVELTTDNLEIKEETETEDPIGLEVPQTRASPAEDQGVHSDIESDCEIVTNESNVETDEETIKRLRTPTPTYSPPAKKRTLDQQEHRPATEEPSQNVLYRNTSDIGTSSRKVITLFSTITGKSAETEIVSTVQVTPEQQKLSKKVVVPVPQQQKSLLCSILDKHKEKKALPQTPKAVAEGQDPLETEAVYIQKLNMETSGTSNMSNIDARDITIPARNSNEGQVPRILDMKSLPVNFKKRLKIISIKPLDRATVQAPSASVVDSIPAPAINNPILKQASVKLHKMPDHEIKAVLDKNKNT